MAAPAGTPAPIINRVYGEIAKILATPRRATGSKSFGVDPGGETPEALAALVRAEHAKLGEVIRAIGITVE